MLSTTGEGPPSTLVDLAHTTLGKKLPDWPIVKTEGEWRALIATFLNGCVDACHSALDGCPTPVARNLRWYNHLKFVVYDKITEDGTEDFPPVKLDLVGGLYLAPGDCVAWSPQSSLTKQVLLPVEVGADWAPIVNQAATYARRLFSASPSRQFATVLGFRHVDAKLRFLVFHRSGLTGSQPFSVQDTQGQKDILRIFLSILEWTSANDAGFLEFCNDSEMCLPRYEGDETGVVASVAKVLHDSLHVRGRGSRVLLMEYPTSGGKESGPHIPGLDSTVRAPKRTEAGNRSKRSGGTRASFHHQYIGVTI
jgi:hypothetical protein